MPQVNEAHFHNSPVYREASDQTIERFVKLQFVLKTSAPLADVGMIPDTEKLSRVDQLLMNPATVAGYRVNK
ncbi:MAG: hypothetical protein F4246_05165 [Rhodothermaceae bacterium]|nr:hypothetical protein [Rhodothermaceae bacterium]